MSAASQAHLEHTLRSERVRDHAEELLEALKWALPLAEIALESHRIDRIRSGHTDIGAERGTDIGLWDSEVAERNTARAAIAAAEGRA